MDENDVAGELSILLAGETIDDQVMTSIMGMGKPNTFILWVGELGYQVTIEALEEV